MTDMQMPKGGETNPLCPFNGEGGSLGEIMIRARFVFSPPRRGLTERTLNVC
jgi:hypothetical protein